LDYVVWPPLLLCVRYDGDVVVDNYDDNRNEYDDDDDNDYDDDNDDKKSIYVLIANDC